MASQEVWIAQLSTQSFDQGNEVLGNVMNSSLHPHGNGGTAEHVQAKSLIDSMLQLIQRVWAPVRLPPCQRELAKGLAVGVGRQASLFGEPT